MSKIIKDFGAYVKRTNKKYEAATKAEKRVMIAKDTIARIEADNIIPRHTGVVTDINPDYRFFKDFINTTGESCQVCAKGALFCSLVGRVNDVKTEDIDNHSNDKYDLVHEKLLDVFTLKQLDLIETAYECCSYLGEIDGKSARKAEKFYDKFSDNDKRLIAICKNIIANQGTFKL